MCIVFVSIFHDEFVSFFLLNSVYSSNGFMMLYVLCRKKMSKKLQFLDSFFVVVEFFLAIWICIKPYISLIALMNMCQECFASIVNVSVNKNMSKNINFWRFQGKKYCHTCIYTNLYLYLSWTFCLISTRLVAEMSRSKYSERVSVAFSKSFWLSCKEILKN